MSKKLYIGNLPFAMTDERLKEIFSAYGEVTEARVMRDKFSGRSRGFGFVAMTDDAEADKAIAEINGKEIDGRKIVVNEARPMDAERRPRQDRY